MKDKWSLRNIDESCEILDNRRVPLNGEQRSLIPGGIPYYGANGVQGYISKYIFDEDLILMAEDGGNFEEYSKRPIAYKISGKSWVNNHAHILKAKNGFNQDFIFYSVVHKNIIPFIKGGTRSKLNLSDLKCVEINFPPLPQQQKIAEILSTCDAVIEKTEAAIAKYKALKQGMMHDLFTRGIDTKTGKLRPKPQDAPELYKESELGLIPKEWEVRTIDEVGRTLTGNTPSTNNPLFYDGNVMFISPADLFGQKNIKKTQKSITKLGLSASREIPPGSISVVCIGSTIGKVAMTTQLCASNQQINTLIPFDIELSDFLYYSSHQFLVHQLFIEAGLQAVPIVNKSTFDTLNILLPNEKQEAKDIAFRLISIDNKIEKEKVSLSKYEQLKAGLMQDLLTGLVEVRVD